MKLSISQLEALLNTRSVLAVELGTSELKVALVKFEKNAPRTETRFTLPFGEDAVLDSPEKTGQKLAAELAAHQIREKKCVVRVPCGWAMTAAVDLPALSPEDVSEYLDLQAEREFPIPRSELRLAHCEYETSAGARRATIAAVANRRIDALTSALAAAGCKPVSVSFGLDPLLPEGGTESRLHLIANSRHVHLVVANPGGVSAIRSLPYGGTDGATFDPVNLAREVRITLGAIAEESPMRLEKAFLQSAHGNGALAESLIPVLQRFGIPLQQDPGAAPSAERAAERYLAHAPVLFEFLPREVNHWDRAVAFFSRKERRTIAMAAVALVLLPILTLIIRSHMEQSLSSEWTGMERKVSELEVVQQKIRQYRPWFDSTPRSVQLLESLATAFPDQAGIWAKSIQVTEDAKVTCSGFASNQSTVMSFLDALRRRPDVTGMQVQQLRGDNPVQFSVTYKWENHDAK